MYDVEAEVLDAIVIIKNILCELNNLDVFLKSEKMCQIEKGKLIERL